MSNVPLFVGVDYHQDQLQICVVDRDARVRLNRTHPNDAAAVATLLAGLPGGGGGDDGGGGDVRAVGIEACCGAADFAEELLRARSSCGGGGYRVELAHPGYVARLKQSPDKTDFSDARLLADLTRVGYLPRVWLPPAAVRDLRQLVNHRASGWSTSGGRPSCGSGGSSGSSG
jgi:hypothetical protein